MIFVLLLYSWARALSHHFLPGTTTENFFDNSSSDHGASIKFSSATQLSSWTDHTLPFPIITVDSFSPSNKDRPLPYGLVPLSNVVYEFTPIEYVFHFITRDKRKFSPVDFFFLD